MIRRLPELPDLELRPACMTCQQRRRSAGQVPLTDKSLLGCPLALQLPSVGMKGETLWGPSADQHMQAPSHQACAPVFRRRWLLGLLVLQSTSSFVLESYQQLIKENLVVTVFLTMLVGAGGNAGNQSAIKVIRGLVSYNTAPPFNLHASSGMLRLPTVLAGGGAPQHLLYCPSSNSASWHCLIASQGHVRQSCLLIGCLLGAADWSYTSRDCAAGNRPDPRQLAISATNSEAAGSYWTHAGQRPFR